jgi:hypothetical protein
VTVSYPKDVRSRLRNHNRILALYTRACRKGQTDTCGELLAILSRELFCVARRLCGKDRENFVSRADYYLACRGKLINQNDRAG